MSLAKQLAKLGNENCEKLLMQNDKRKNILWSEDQKYLDLGSKSTLCRKAFKTNFPGNLIYCKAFI